jgi:hypothetical protein
MKKVATLALTLALGFVAVATTGCGEEKKPATPAAKTSPTK